MNKLLAADANDAFHVLGDGKHEWGAGGASAVDTTLYRSAADRLKTDDHFDATTLALATKVKAGAPVDGDWAVAPPDGTIVINSTTQGTWARLGGVWVPITIPSALIDAKGDLIVGTADNTPARLAVGTDGQVLTADSPSAGGVKWAAAAGGGDMVKIAEVILGADGASLDISSIPATYRSLVLNGVARSASGSSDTIGIRFNNDSGATYDWVAVTSTGAAAAAAAGNGATSATIADVAAGNTTTRFSAFFCEIPNYYDTTLWKAFVGGGGHSDTANIRHYFTNGNWQSAAAINRITLILVSGSNFRAGSKFYLYGLK